MSKIPPQRISALFHVFKLFNSNHLIYNFIIYKIQISGDKDKQKSATFVFVIKMLSYYEQTIETFLLVTLPDIISGYFGHDTGGPEK